MKSEQHVWEEIQQSVFKALVNLKSEALYGIRDMEKIDEVIHNSGYSHLYRKRGGGSSAQFEKMTRVVEETATALNASNMHRNALASIDSKFAEKMKHAIEDYLNKVNEGDHKYIGNTTKTVDKTITVANDYGTNSTVEIQETVPLTADELMQLNHPKLQGLKDKYQNELETYKNKMLSDEQIKLSDEQKKNIENMSVSQFLGYTGSVGEYKGALSDYQESMKTFMLIADIGIALGATLLAPCTGGVSLGVAAGYFIGKATYGIVTGKSLLVDEKLSNEDKAWLIFDAATSVLAAGATMKALSNGGKIANTVAKTAMIGDHTMNFVQAGMAGATGVQMLQKGDVLGGVTLLGLAALGARGTAKATSKVVGEVEENATKAVNKTSLAAERMNQFVDKVEDLKIKGANAFDNAAVKFADAMGNGDNLAFAGAGGSFGKNWNHADDFVGRTVARVEGAVDGQLDDVVDVSEKVHHTEIPKWDSKKMLSEQQGIEEALNKNKMTLTELDNTNTLASQLDVNGKKAIHTEITQAQKVATDIGLPQPGEKIVKVRPPMDHPFYIDSETIPDVQGFVAREVDVKSLNTLEEHIEGLGLNYPGSNFKHIEEFIVDEIPVMENITSELDHPFNRPLRVSGGEPPYTNTGFTSGGAKEFHANSYPQGKNVYRGETLPHKTIRKVYDQSGNVTKSAEWRVITDINGNKYGNWWELSEFGRYEIPVVKNKQGGVLIEPIKK